VHACVCVMLCTAVTSVCVCALVWVGGGRGGFANSRVCVHTCVSPCVYMCTHTCVYVCACTRVYVLVCMSVCGCGCV